MEDPRKIKVLDIMTKKPIVVGPNHSIDKCANLMVKEDVGSLIVEENKYIKGIITEKDLVKKVVAKAKDIKKLKAKDIMSNIIVTVKPDSDIIEAMKIMDINKVRRLPVVNDGKLIGLLTVRDILKVQPELISLRVDRWVLKEEKDKLGRFFDGECEDCGNFTLLERVGYNLLCNDCRREKYF